MSTQTPIKLWNRNFTILWLGMVQSRIGDAFLSIGLMWLALEMTGSPLIAATILALEGIPKLFGPLAGAVVDRANKQKLMVGCDVVRGLLLIALFLGNLTGVLQLWHLYTLVVALSMFSLFYGPSLRIMLPTLVPNTALPAANSLLQGALQVSTIAGSSLAGVALALLGPGLALLLDGVSFLLAALALLFVAFPANLRQSAHQHSQSLLSDMLDGLRYILTSRQIVLLTALAFFLNLVLSPVNVIFPVFSRDVLGGGVAGFGFLASAIAVGLLLGNVVSGLLGDRLPYARTILLGLLGLTTLLLGLGFTQSLWLALLLTAGLGVMASIIQVPLVSQLQRAVPQHYQGRVFATLETIVTIALPLAAGLAGGALVALPIPLIFRAAAFGSLLVAGVWGVLSIGSARQPEAAPPIPAAVPDQPH